MSSPLHYHLSLLTLLDSICMQQILKNSHLSKSGEEKCPFSQGCPSYLSAVNSACTLTALLQEAVWLEAALCLLPKQDGSQVMALRLRN